MSEQPENDDWLDEYALHFAAADGNLDLVAKLIAEGRPLNAFDELDRTPLHYAADKEHLEVVELLLRYGADVNAQNKSRAGNTPLAEVAQSCSLKMAELLLRAGADPRIPGWMQLTAIHRASKRKRGDGPQVIELLNRWAERRNA